MFTVCSQKIHGVRVLLKTCDRTTHFNGSAQQKHYYDNGISVCVRLWLRNYSSALSVKITLLTLFSRVFFE